MARQSYLCGAFACACLFLGCGVSEETPAPLPDRPAPKVQADAPQPALKAENARNALVSMLQKKPEPQYVFGGMDPDHVNGALIETESEYCWIADFRVNLRKKTYDVVHDPKSGRKSDASVHGGTFELIAGQWTATMPKLLGHLECQSLEGKK